MGIMSIGAVVSTANPLYTSSELQKQIEDSMPVLVLTTPHLLHKFNNLNVRIVMIGTHEQSGATVVILPKFTMEGMLMAIQRYGVTHLPAVPAIFIRLSKLPDVDQKYDLSSLKEVIVGGASMGREQMEAFRSRFPGIGISQV